MLEIGPKCDCESELLFVCMCPAIGFRIGCNMPTTLVRISGSDNASSFDVILRWFYPEVELAASPYLTTY